MFHLILPLFAGMFGGHRSMPQATHTSPITISHPDAKCEDPKLCIHYN